MREDLRRGGLEHLARRITGVRGRPPAAGLERAVDLLYAIVSFHTFDDAAGPDRPLSAVAPDVIRLARAALGVTDTLSLPGVAREAYRLVPHGPRGPGPTGRMAGC